MYIYIYIFIYFIIRFMSLKVFHWRFVLVPPPPPMFNRVSLMCMYTLHSVRVPCPVSVRGESLLSSETVLHYLLFASFLVLMMITAGT